MEGKGTWAIVLLVCAVLLVGGGISFVGYQMNQQSVVGADPGEVTEAAEATAAGLKVGDAATTKFRAYDNEDASLSQVAATLYVEEHSGEDYALIEDATAMSASAATSVSTTVGSELKACAFDSTYYGECAVFTVSKETMPKNLEVYAIASSVLVECYDDGSKLTDCNLTLAAGQTDALDYVRIELNESDAAFNFKGIGIDTTASGNITNIDATGSITPSGSLSVSTVPTRLNRGAYDVDFYWTVADAVMLHEWDVITTSSVSFEADSGNDPSETATMYIVDESMFKSVVKSTQNRILSGVETDASSPADVGITDPTLTINLN